MFSQVYEYTGIYYSGFVIHGTLLIEFLCFGPVLYWKFSHSIFEGALLLPRQAHPAPLPSPLRFSIAEFIVPHGLLSDRTTFILGLIGINIEGLGVSRLPDFGVDGSWGLHEILLSPIMYGNMRWEHFPKWWLFRNRKICLYKIKILWMIPSILCYMIMPLSAERLGPTTPQFSNQIDASALAGPATPMGLPTTLYLLSNTYCQISVDNSVSFFITLKIILFDQGSIGRASEQAILTECYKIAVLVGVRVITIMLIILMLTECHTMHYIHNCKKGR